jgi:hypothetical protein
MKQLLQEYFESGEPLLKMDGFDDCIAGVIERIGQEPIICYDKTKVLDQMVKDGMTYEEAVEYFEYNQLGAWVGERTPCFLITEPQ